MTLDEAHSEVMDMLKFLKLDGTSVLLTPSLSQVEWKEGMLDRGKWFNAHITPFPHSPYKEFEKLREKGIDFYFGFDGERMNWYIDHSFMVY